MPKIKHLTTEDPTPKALAKTLPQRPPVEVKRGPQIGAVGLGDKDVVNLHGTAEDMAAMRATIDARMKPAPGTTAWRKLPDGTSVRATTVLTGCPGCGAWAWTEPRHARTPCVQCTMPGRVGVAVKRLATATEEKAWFARETKRVADFKADKPVREAELAAYNKRRLQDLGR